VELLNNVASQIKGKCLCALGEFSIEAVLSGIDRFRVDFKNVVAEKKSQMVE
jgi:NADH-quinone oxidoreductase subunit F